jgi:hypothetical protein
MRPSGVGNTFFYWWLTKLLLDHYPKERSPAIEHLDFAFGEFREMKMEPALRQALRRTEGDTEGVNIKP